MPTISACIVAYCDYDEVCAAVRSVLANTPAPMTLPCMWWITPARMAAARRLAQTPILADVRVQVLCLPENLGFGQRPQQPCYGPPAPASVHFILNPDM